MAKFNHFKPKDQEEQKPQGDEPQHADGQPIVGDEFHAGNVSSDDAATPDNNGCGDAPKIQQVDSSASDEGISDTSQSDGEVGSEPTSDSGENEKRPADSESSSQAARNESSSNQRPIQPKNKVDAKALLERLKHPGAIDWKGLLRFALTAVLGYASVVLVLLVAYALFVALGDKGFVPRFCLSAGTALIMLAIPYLIVVAVLCVCKVMGKSFLNKKNTAVTAGVASLLLIIFSSVMATDPSTCMHAEIIPATCTERERCAECGKEFGKALGHTWKAATCTEPMTCAVCGATTGEPKGHVSDENWTVTKEPTCTEPGERESTCTVCGDTVAEEVPATGHAYGEPIVTREATCTSSGEQTFTCTVCGETTTGEIPATGHTPGEPTVTQQPTASYQNGSLVTTSGKREVLCTVCGAVISSEEIEPDDSMIESAYKASCSEFSYTDVARNPDAYDGASAVFRGKVVQVMQQGNIYILRVNKDSDYNSTVYVTYLADEGAPRILEDDVVTLWGSLNGLMTYETIFGASVTIPSFVALYVE